jgi:hypothetical protein
MNIYKIIKEEYDSIIDIINKPPTNKKDGDSGNKLYSFKCYIYIPENLIGYTLDNMDIDREFIEFYLKGKHEYKEIKIYILNSKYKNTIGTKERINQNEFIISGYLYSKEIDNNVIISALTSFLNSKLNEFKNSIENTIKFLGYSNLILDEYSKPDKYEIIKKYFT